MHETGRDRDHADLAALDVDHDGRLRQHRGLNRSEYHRRAKHAQITQRHAPFLTGTVKPRGAWVTNDHSLTGSSSLGDYVAMVSGQYTPCEAHNDLPDHCHQRAPSLFGQLAASGRSWRDWEESMANACGPIDDGAAWAKNIYSAHHNPALYFTQLQGGRVDEAIAPAARCRADDLPMGTTGPDDTTKIGRAHV